MTDVLNRVNQTELAAELLKDAAEMHARLPADDHRSFEGRAISLFKMLDRKGLSAQRADLALAIDFRLTALARLMQDRQVRGWTLPAGQAGADFVHPNLIRAAAEEPVIEDANGQPAFDPESFRNRVLLLTGTRGEAKQRGVAHRPRRQAGQATASSPRLVQTSRQTPGVFRHGSAFVPQDVRRATLDLTDSLKKIRSDKSGSLRRQSVTA